MCSEVNTTVSRYRTAHIHFTTRAHTTLLTFARAANHTHARNDKKKKNAVQ